MKLRMFLQKLVFAVGFALCWGMLLAKNVDIANYVIGGVLVAEAVLMIGDESSWVPIIIMGAAGVVVIGGNALFDFIGEAGAFAPYIVLAILPVLTVVFAVCQFSMSKIASEHTGGALFGGVGFLYPVVMIVGSALTLFSNFAKNDDALKTAGTVVALVGCVAWAAWAVWARVLYKQSYGDGPSSARRKTGGSSGGGGRGRGKVPTRNDVQQAASWAAINCYMELVNVSGSTGNITVVVSGAPDSSRQETYMDELAKQLAGYDTSGITIRFS